MYQLVWVLMLFTPVNSGQNTVLVDNIATAESCEQLAKVYRAQNRVYYKDTGKTYDPNTAICAPVRKFFPK